MRARWRPIAAGGVLVLMAASSIAAARVAPLPRAAGLPVVLLPDAAGGAARLSEIWQRLFRPTNSHAAAVRGARQFAKKNFEQAARSFDVADHLAPDAKSAFNLGTAQIAAGRGAEGSATMARALRDAGLRPDALYNRGNGALASKAYEYAIRDYVDTLKLRPGDMAAKRNLEIALKRLDQMRRSTSSGGNNGQQQRSQEQQKAASAGQQRQQRRQQGDTEALLRSVQQQEQEELERMKRARAANVRVGW